MNEMTLPASPNWYADSIMICTPDEDLIYSSHRDIIVLKPAPVTEAAPVLTINNAHTDKILSVNANLVTWGNPNKYIVSVGEDRVVNLWDFAELKMIKNHNAHKENDSPLVGVSFAGERIISVAENGQIGVWQFVTNTTRVINCMFEKKSKVICMSTCPHATYITAFGLTTGLVAVCDLRGQGRVLYRMREHDHDITGLSWCPVPYNIYKTVSGIKMMNAVKEKVIWASNATKEDKNNAVENSKDDTQSSLENVEKMEPETKDEADIPSETENKNDSFNDFAQKCIKLQQDLVNREEQKQVELTEQKKIVEQIPESQEVSSHNFLDSPMRVIKPPSRPKPVVDKKNPWGNVEFHDSDDENEIKTIEKPRRKLNQKVGGGDFLSECANLKKHIIRLANEPEDEEDLDESSSDKKEDSKDEMNKGKKDIKPEIVGDCAESELSGSVVEKLENLSLSQSKSQEDKKLNDSQKAEILDLTLPDLDSSKEYLLASACRGGTVCIWRAGTDGRLEIQLSKHTKTSSSNKKRDNHKNWVAICWVQPTLILTSSIWHELLSWNLLPFPNKNNKYIIKSSLIHTDHKRQIFCICTPFKLFDKPESEDWKENKLMYAWTNSLDRWILKTNLSTRCNVACYSTFAGLVNCMSVSQLDPNRISFAVGDGSIRVWDLSRPHLQHVMMTTLFDKVHSKASSLDWHPVKENCLAFATCEGRIGEYDLINKSKAATVFSNYHRSNVSRIQYGPLPSAENKYGLYSCSLGELIVHDPSRPQKEPYQIQIFEDENITTFAWKSDYSVLAVASRMGSVRLVNPKFKAIETLYMQKKSVRCLEWHPLATAYDSGLSEFANYLAVATIENIVYVYDCVTTQNDSESSSNHKVIALEGHKLAVKSLSWCPHTSGRLVSTCEAGIAMVWDVKSQTVLSTYNANMDSAPSVIWSPLDADLIILGGKHLIIWRITNHPPIQFDNTKKEFKYKNYTRVTTYDESYDIRKQERKAEKRKKIILGTVTKKQNNRAICLDICWKLLEKLDARKKSELKIKNQNDDSESDSDSEPFEDASEHTDESEFNVDPIKLFGNHKETLALLNYEQSLLLQKKNVVHHAHIGLWKGNIADSIKHAIETKQINPWLINMAPMVSHKLWLELCLKYAEMLEESDEHIEASSYYLVCHEVDKAIDVLCKGNFYMEALGLAQARLPEGSSTINEIIEKMLMHHLSCGNYEIVAQCYIHLGKFGEAAEHLKKRNDLPALELAADLAKRAGNRDLYTSLNIQVESLKTKTCMSRFEALQLKNKNSKNINETHDIINGNEDKLNGNNEVITSDNKEIITDNEVTDNNRVTGNNDTTDSSGNINTNTGVENITKVDNGNLEIIST